MGIFNWFKRSFSPSFKGNCVPRMLYQGCGWSYQKKLPVRFMIRELKPGRDHGQCQVLIDNRWHWSSQDGDRICLGSEEYPHARIKKVISLKKLFKERLDAIPDE